MRTLVTALLALAAAGGTYAQHRFRPASSPAPFGNILFPGTGGPPGKGLLPSVPPGRAGGHGRHQGPGGFIPIPFAVPVFVGGYGYPSYQQYAPSPPPNVTVVVTTPSPSVVINQNFGVEQAPAETEAAPESSSLRFYEAPRTSNQAPPEQNQTVTFLIALKDSSVYTAAAYWVQGETLHYVTPQGKHNQVSLALVDRKMSATLNQGQKAEIVLPPEN